MSFSTIGFIGFYLPIFILIYRIFPPKCQKAILALGGLVFYAIGSWRYFPMLMVSLGLNYLLHLWISHVNKKRLLLIVAVILNVIPLILNKISGELALGISFYTFQIISLQIDSKDERIKFVDYCAFTVCFPKLIMGPLARIGKWKDAFKRAETEHLLTLAGLENGLKIFTIGLAFKVLLADNLAFCWNSILTTGVYGITTSVAWLGVIVYTIRLYFDFYGYSLMAYGLGIILGLPIVLNFNEPYSAKTIGDFWRRWNLTLGEWFRDYIYIPLGGNRKGKVLNIVNLLIVWLLTGVWHGFGINFLIWSMVLWLLIVLERMTPLGKLENSKVFGHIYVCILIPLTWIFFANENTSNLVVYLKCMIGIYDEAAIVAKGQFIRYLSTYWYLIALGVFFMTPVPRKLYKKFENKIVLSILLIIVFLCALYFVFKGNGSGFLYYNF